MQNPLIGEYDVQFSAGGPKYRLRYTWHEVAIIEAKYGLNIPPLDSLEVLAAMAAIGFSHYHPELDADGVKALSPPIFVLQQSVLMGLRCAYMGTTEEVQAKEENGDDAKKKPLWQTLWLLPFRWVFRRKSSGS